MRTKFHLDSTRINHIVEMKFIDVEIFMEPSQIVIVGMEYLDLIA